ncbi:multidrug efflux system protein MdtO [Salmonella enterica subsp. arizonae]|uniref:Multidrug efflux system protein MdtO n=1 Tax=Salmonella enterica subsp. arizonae TaxID=59203 RepID=A0A379SBM1_SALER|nr:multidrug efflux system protein MdtO [Salmonella enterica subsp. arizonae]
MRHALCARLDDAVSHLLSDVAPQAEKYIERNVLALQKLNVFCLADDADWQARSVWWQNCVSTVTYLYTTLNRYSADAASQYPALVQKIRNEIASLQQAVAQGEPWQSTWSLSAQERVVARACGLETLCDQLRQLGEMSPDTPPAPAARPPAMTPDAFSNPVYIRYALKTLLACMICYVFYSGVDWEGIHTCMLTCIIVANPSIGSSYQKMSLRFGGALCGALLALLVAIFAMPWLDNIAELLCLLAPVFLLGAWIATGSGTIVLYRHANDCHLCPGDARKRLWPGLRSGRNPRSRNGDFNRHRGFPPSFIRLSGRKAKRAHCRKNWLAR